MNDGNSSFRGSIRPFKNRPKVEGWRLRGYCWPDLLPDAIVPRSDMPTYPHKKDRKLFSRGKTLSAVFIYILFCCTTLTLLRQKIPFPTKVVHRVSRLVERLYIESIDWDGMLARHQGMPKYAQDLHTNDIKSMDLRIHIISLERSPRRTETLTAMLDQHNTSYAVFPAIDGLVHFHPQDLSTYAGEERQKLMELPGSPLFKHAYKERNLDPLLTKLHRVYNSGVGITRTERAALHERLRFGCYLSHVKLWFKLLASSWDFMLILEDDAAIEVSQKLDNGDHIGTFDYQVKSALRHMPLDWDILWLESCADVRVGGFLAKGVRQFRGGSCTLGYLISRKGAYRWVAHFRQNKPVDNMMMHNIKFGLTSSWICDPPLLRRQQDTVSELAY